MEKQKIRKKRLDIALIVIYIFLVLLSLITVLPVLNLLGVSLSDGAMATKVFVIPRGWNLQSYLYVLKRSYLVRSFLISIARIIVGTTFQTLITIFSAYALSKPDSVFKGRTVYAWFFFLAMIFDGGLIPFYMMVRQVGLLNNFLALIIPSGVQVFNILLLLNYFKQLPREIEESAMLDGAGYFISLWRIIVPISMPAVATGIIFSVVGHWNAWLDGAMFLRLPEDYPLQTYVQAMIGGGGMQTVVGGSTQTESGSLSDKVSIQTIKAALIIVAMLPMVIFYPFIQKYFQKGMIIGSVKN